MEVWKFPESKDRLEMAHRVRIRLVTVDDQDAPGSPAGT